MREMTGSRQPLVERLRRQVVILDGGMGTALQARGLPSGHPADLWSVERPEEVARVHRAHLDAGAEVIYTNTFGASRLRLGPYGWGDRVREVNRAAARLAQAEARGAALVAGDIGPCGPTPDTFRALSRAKVMSSFAEQVEALASAGVDLLVIETLSDLGEMEEAVRAALTVAPHLPILASLTFAGDGRLRTGESPAEAARFLEDLGVEIVGANCSLGVQALLPVCEAMARATTIPLAMKPGAGVPSAAPPAMDEMADYARRFVEAGASLVGGCCGVTPAMLRAIALAVKGMTPARRAPLLSAEIQS
jgi:5-methyltetrahydrofolate--homocysteine methyltransferase